MKKIYLVILTTVLAITAAGQQFKMDKIYAQFGTNALEIKTVFNNKWVITASTSHFQADPKLPGDYKATSHPGVDIGPLFEFFLVLFSFGLYEPGSASGPYSYHLNPTDVRFSHIAFGRYYQLSRSFSFTADAGLGIAKADQYVFSKTTFQNKIRNAYFDYSDNYDITTKNTTNVGGIARVGFDWAFSSFAGLGVDAFYNFNAGGIKSNSGVNVKLLIGWMNRPPKKKTTWR